MKIVVISNAYKGNLSSSQVADYISQGILRVIDADIVKLAVADGGDGTLDTLLSFGGVKKSARVLNAQDKLIRSHYGILDNGKGVIEMALASGISILDRSHLNPMIATSYGTGQLIKCLLDEEVRDIIIGIGGSATNDGGTGLAEALGVKFYDKDGNIMHMNGSNLLKIDSIDMSEIDMRLQECRISVACDVTNPLYGYNGAAHIYAPQKGATREQVELLDKGLQNLNRVVSDLIGEDLSNIEGAGAAGGMGYGLMAFVGAELKSGIDTVLDTIDYDKHLEGANLVFTGEGRIDNQSAYGKVPAGVARRAKLKGVPVIAIAGSIGDVDKLYDIGISAVISTAEGDCTLQYAISNAPRLIANAAERVMRIWEAKVL